MTWDKRFEKKLKACLRQAQRTRRVAERGIEQIRRLLDETRNMAAKELYRRQIDNLQSIVRSCEREEATIRQLLHRIQNEPHEGANGHAPPPPPPSLPTTIRVYVPKGLQITDDEIVKLVLQKLNLNEYAKEAKA
jgi:hypothetical protein